MKYQISIILSLFCNFLYIGCSPPAAPRTYESSGRRADELPWSSTVKPNNGLAEDVVNVSEPEGDLLLGQALALTLTNNPELKVFSLEIRSAEARQLQSGLWPNPELELEMEEFGGSGEKSGFDVAETTIQLSQLIELGNKAQKRGKVAFWEKESAILDYEAKKLEIFGEAANAFIEIITAQEKLALSHELLNLAQESFDIVEKRVALGRDSPLEKNRASIELATIRIAHGQAQRYLEYVRKRLATFWDQEQPVFVRAVGDIYHIEQPPSQEEVTGHLRQNPQYRWWESEMEKNQAKLHLEKAKTLGDITISGGLKQFNETNDNALVVGVSIPLPISDRNQGGYQEAVIDLAKSREEENAAWLRLKNNLNQIYQEYVNAYSQANSLKQEVLPAAQAMFDAATAAYQQGKTDYQHVLDAQRTLFSVKTEYIDSLSAYHVARTNLERLLGQSHETFNPSKTEQ